MNEFLNRLRAGNVSPELVAYIEHELVHGKLEIAGRNVLRSEHIGIVLVIGSDDVVDMDAKYFAGI